jgi:site-specific DNA recombinase
MLFERDCENNGVKIIYRSIPEGDPIFTTMMKGFMQTIDQWHSMTSKKKGLAGMAENVRKGFRAGGRAPRGYRLVTIDTGAVREGERVTKSKLEPNDDGAVVGQYLSLRAEGVPRTAAMRQLKIKWPVTSLVGLEWNALTYAGHTVWNVHAEFGADGYKGGAKRRPRDEWVIQRDTHEPLVSNAIAETVLQQIENSDHGGARHHGNSHLLTGLLRTIEGKPWHGNRVGETELLPRAGCERHSIIEG